MVLSKVAESNDKWFHKDSKQKKWILKRNSKSKFVQLTFREGFKILLFRSVKVDKLATQTPEFCPFCSGCLKAVLQWFFEVSLNSDSSIVG